MGTYAGNRVGVVCPFMLEASADVCALKLVQQMGFLNIEIEGDALGFIRKLQGVEEDLSPIETLVDEAKAKSRYFRSCSFMHTGLGAIWLLIVWQNMGWEYKERRYS
ncbi:hypothetical protein CRYUN_Cryun37aG0003200 [Craigia yunnanensis]